MLFCVFRSIFRWFKVLLQPSASGCNIISEVFFWVLTSGPLSGTFFLPWLKPLVTLHHSLYCVVIVLLMFCHRHCGGEPGFHKRQVWNCYGRAKSMTCGIRCFERRSHPTARKQKGSRVEKGLQTGFEFVKQRFGIGPNGWSGCFRKETTHSAVAINATSREHVPA